MFAPEHRGARIAQSAFNYLNDRRGRIALCEDLASLDRLQQNALTWPSEPRTTYVLATADNDGLVRIYAESGQLMRQRTLHAECWLESFDEGRTTAFRWRCLVMRWEESELNVQ